MSRAPLAFAFAIACLAVLPFEARSQTNSEKASQVSGPAPEPPVPPKAIKDSVKAAKAKAKKARAAADTTKPAGPAAPAATPAPAPTQPAAPGASTTGAPESAPAPASVPAAKPDSAKAAAPGAESAATPSVNPDSSQAKAETANPVPNQAPTDILAVKPDPVRAPQDLRLFNDPPLIGREYGFGILGSVVAGTLCFYIGSGIETAIVGERRAHKGTLTFTGIRYDNFKGAFWGGSAGMILGSALTTYFTGQTDEEDGGFFATLAGTTAAAAGAFYLASAMGVNDDIDWKPFIPLLAIPSIGGTLGFNLSRWFNDHEREKVVGKEAAVRLHAPDLSWGMGPGGERVQLTALRLTF